VAQRPATPLGGGGRDAASDPAFRLHLEDKRFGVAWHYRQADAEFGAVMARELRHHLRALLASAPLEVVAGHKVVEVRPIGAHKGRVVAPAVAAAGPGAHVLAMGDDRTDLDLFGALPDGAVSIAVGDRVARATWRLPDPAAVRALLARVAALRRELARRSAK
jgi:trehalose 6-phosphate synthase/phosphatase